MKTTNEVKSFKIFFPYDSWCLCRVNVHAIYWGGGRTKEGRVKTLQLYHDNFKQINSKCHEVTLMIKLLTIIVTCHMSRNKVSDTKCHYLYIQFWEFWTPFRGHISWIGMLNNYTMSMPRLQNGQQVEPTCKHMTFDIDMLEDILL